MLSPSRFRAGAACKIVVVFALISFLFMTGCTASGPSSTGGSTAPTAPSLSASVSGLGNVSPGQTGAMYSILVSNSANAISTSGTVTVTDPPTNFIVTGVAGTGWTGCPPIAGNGFTCTRSDALAPGQSYPPIMVTGNVTGTPGQNITVPITISGGGLTSTVTSSPAISIVSPPSISKAFNPGTVTLNANSALTFTITNPPANNVAQSGVAFTDALPAGVVVASTPGVTNSCGGTPTAAAATSSISLNGGSVPAQGACTLTVSVTGTTLGSHSNTTGTVSSTNGGTGAVSNTATLTVVAAPAVTSFAPAAATITAGASTTLTAVFTNGTGSVSNGVGAVTSGTAVTVTPTATTTYTLTVTNTAGTSVTFKRQ